MLATFHPGARAKTDADVRTVGDLQRAHVAIEITEDTARDSAQLRHGRIVWMDADPHAQLFYNGHNLPDEIGVVFPKLFLAEFAPVRQRALKDFAIPNSLWILVHVEGTR